MSHATGTDHHLRRRATWMLCLACLLWALSFPLVKALALIHASFDPEADGFLRTTSAIWPRFLMASILLLPLVVRRGLPLCTRLEFRQGIGLAVFLAGGLVLQVDGLQYTEASTSAFLTQCYVVLLPLWVYGRARAWPTFRFISGTALAVIGLGVLAGLTWNDFSLGRGEAETIASTVFFTAQILWLERPVFRANRAMSISLVMFVTTAVLFFVVALVHEGRLEPVLAPWHSRAWLAGSAALAVVCTFGAFTLMNAFQKWVSSAEAGVVYTLEPVFASILALFVPGILATLGGVAYANESITWRLLIGGGLISVANIVIQTASKAPQPEIRTV